MITDNSRQPCHQQLGNGFRLLGRSLSIIAKATGDIINRSVHRFPYAYIVSILLVSIIACFVSIARARAERDNAMKQQVLLQQQLDTLKFKIKEDRI